MLLGRDRRAAVNESDQLVVGLGPRDQADGDGDDHADDPRPEPAVHVLGHGLGVGREGNTSKGPGLRLREHSIRRATIPMSA